MCSFEAALLKENVTKLAAPRVECTAFTQNPSNANEWLFFLNCGNSSGYRESHATINDIYSYNRITNKFCQVHFDTCPNKDGLKLENSSQTYVCKGCKPNTLIVMISNAIWDDHYNKYHFYNVFNTKKMKWQKKDNCKKYISNLKSNSKNCRLVEAGWGSTTRTSFGHLFGPSKQLVTFKYWIIVSGGDSTHSPSLQNIMSIYELDKNTQQPKPLKIIELHHKYENHAMMIISQSLPKKGKKSKKFKVKLLLFGGVAENRKKTFLDSFSVVSIVFTKSDYHDSFDVSYKVYEISSKWMERNIFGMTDIDSNSNIAKLIKHQRIWSSENCLINNEYALLFVNTDSVGTLLYFNIGNIVYNNDKYNDSEKKDDIHICDNKKCGILTNLTKQIKHVAESAGIHKNNFSQYYFDFIYAPKNDKYKQNEILVCGYLISIQVLLKITINTHILWQQERIIWIAFHKNEKNIKCLVPQLPKDVVKQILKLLH